MAYASSKFRLWSGGVVNRWIYDTTDLPATFLASGYVSNGVTITNGAQGKGVRPGDTVTVRRFTDVADDTTWAESIECVVSSVNTTTGAATLKVKGGAVGTATATAGAATLNGTRGVVTTEALTTAAAGEYTLTLTNSQIAVGDVVLASVGLGSATAGTPGIGGVTVAAGSATITVTNLHASAAFDGTLKINFVVFKA